MNTVRSLVLKRIMYATLAVAIAAAAGLLLARTPMQVAHRQPGITVSTLERNSIATTGTTKQILVTLDDVADAPVIVGAEFEQGPNDPDNYGPDPFAQIDYSAPDAWCTVDPGQYDCTLELSFFAPSTAEPIRIYVASGQAFIDTHEQSTPFALGGWGCADEPDSTESIRVAVLGSYTDQPEGPPEPPAGTDPDPETCDTGGPTPTPSSSSPTPSESGSASPTPSESGSASPTPSESITGTPTPTTTITVSPSPTATPTPEPVVVTAPYEGRYREHRCMTYLPAGGTAPCETAADSYAETGVAHAVAGVAPADSPTMSQADASSGVIQSAELRGGTLLARFRIHQASVRSEPASPTLGAPLTAIEVWLTVTSQCTSESQSLAIPIEGNADLENQVVEVRLEYQGCDTVSSIKAGIRTMASTTPLSAGRARAEAFASVERITIT